MYLARVLCRLLTADFNLLAWLVGELTTFFLSGTWPFSAFSKCRHWRGARTKRRGFSRRMPREGRSDTCHSGMRPQPWMRARAAFAAGHLRA